MGRPRWQLGLWDLGRLLVDAVDIVSDHHAGVVFRMLNLRLQPDQFTEVAFGDFHPCEHLCRFRIFQNRCQTLAGARGEAVVEAELHCIIESGDGVVSLVQFPVQFRDLILIPP